MAEVFGTVNDSYIEKLEDEDHVTLLGTTEESNSHYEEVQTDSTTSRWELAAGCFEFY